MKYLLLFIQRFILLVLWFIAILVDGLLIVLTLGLYDDTIRKRKPLLSEIVNNWLYKLS